MNPAQIQLIAATLQAKYLRLINERGLPRPSPIQRYGTGRSSSSHNSRNNEEVRNNQTQGQKEMLARLKSGLQTALVYENDELQDEARAVIPVDRLHMEAHNNSEKNKTTFQVELVKSLLHWFKTDFFKWVNEPPCETCGGKTKGIGSATPTPDDLKWGAGRVELYQCTSCTSQTRFPRYGHPGKLLSYRRGRCGEWANTFTLICRAMGLEARYVMDFTDHVWTEIYIESEKRWVHCDSCEGAGSYDSPLLYEVGWGKKLSYIFGFSADQVIDLHRRYTMSPSNLFPRRTMVSESWLANQIQSMTNSLRQTLSDNTKKEFQERDELEEKEMVGFLNRKAKKEEQGGRESGSLEWRATRGEIGPGVTEIKGTQSMPEKGMTLFEFPSLSSTSPPLKSSSIHFVGTAKFTPLRHMKQSNTTSSSSSLLSSSFNIIDPTPQSIQLTPLSTNACGAVWTKDKIDFSKRAIVEFSFSCTGGADGFAFVLQNQGKDAIGAGGSGLGYDGLFKSIAIEFDIYESKDRCDDPNDNHISVHAVPPPGRNSSHHRASLGNTIKIPRLSNGKPYFVRLIIRDSKISILLTEAEDLEYEMVLEVKVNIKDICEDNLVWAGFTASSGGIEGKFEVWDWNIWQIKS